MTLPHRIGVAILVVATVCAFSPVLFGGAVFLAWDDNANIVYQPAVQALDGANLASVWSGVTLSQGLYEPLSVMLQMLTIELFGLDVRAFHVVTLVIHVVNACLVLSLALRLLASCDTSVRAKIRPEWAALVAALLFALHPMRVEVVAWATGQSYALSALFVLLSLRSYLRHVELRGRGEPGSTGGVSGPLAVSVALYACAVLSKGAAIFLPPALLLLDYFPLRRRLDASLLLEKLPHALVGAGLFALIWGVIADRQGPGYFELDWVARIAYAINALSFHLGKSLWPASVHPAYGVSLTEVSPLSGPLLFSTAIAVFLLGLGWQLRERAPWVTCALGIYGLALLPVCGLFKHGDWLLGADRYAYLPLIGIWIVLGALLTSRPLVPAISLASGRARSVGAVLLLVLATWGVTTFRLARHWREDETLWTYTLDVDPANRVALQNLGTVYMAQQRYEEAVPLFTSALRLDPGHNVAAPLNLGVALHNLDRAQEAVAVYEDALVHHPRSAALHNNLGAAYWKLGETEASEEHLQRSQELQAEALVRARQGS